MKVLLALGVIALHCQVRGQFKNARKPVATIKDYPEDIQEPLMQPPTIEVKVSVGETAPTTALNDGYNIPLLGLGTFGTLWNDKHAKEQVVPALRESLGKLDLDYIDLYLIHSPRAEKSDGRSESIDIAETWAGMEECKKLGLARSIGVSNFNTEQIDHILEKGKIRPAVNQIEVHPSNTQEQLVKDCQIRNITVMAYSPFGFMVTRGKHNTPSPQKDDPKLLELAKKYSKSTAQIVLRYLIDRYLIPIPKSTNNKRIEENIKVFDFRLTDDEVNTINRFNSNSSVFDDDI